VALTRTEINKRFRERHPEKYTADARRERREANDKQYRTTESYQKAQNKYKQSTKAKSTAKYHHYSTKYGLSILEVQEKYQSQKGLCGLCNRELPLELSQCHYDHNHITGKLRDILHRRCNLLVGFIEADSNLTNQAFDYLKRHNET